MIARIGQMKTKGGVIKIFRKFANCSAKLSTRKLFFLVGTSDCLPLYEAAAALQTFAVLPIRLIAPTERVTQDTCDIAIRYHMTYYDAAFLALAKAIGATLITANIKHQCAVAGVKVIALRDYR